MSLSSFVCLHRAHEQQPFRDYLILHSQIVIVGRDSGTLIILFVDKKSIDNAGPGPHANKLYCNRRRIATTRLATANRSRVRIRVH